jgi:hypothetical protein
MKQNLGHKETLYTMQMMLQGEENAMIKTPIVKSSQSCSAVSYGHEFCDGIQSGHHPP